MRNFFARHPALKPLLPVGVLMLLVVLVAGVFVALVATGYRPPAAAPTSAAAATSRVASPGSERFASASIDPGPAPAAQASQDADTRATSALPRTSDAATFAAAYATALFSYDTRREPEAAWAASLSAGLDQTSDVHSDNVADLAARTPPSPVWQAMTTSGQYATFTVSKTWIPQLWKQNATAYPAGAAAVTVSGTQHVTWRGGTSDVPSSVTLLLVCPPLESTCVVNRIATQVLQ